MTDPQRDYYEVLGVARDADAKAIKDAFRNLALKYHPDRNKAPDAEARFKEIAEAYAILSDPKKRATYDSRGFAGVEGFTAEDLFSGIDFGDIFGNSGFGFDFGGDLFGGLFGRRRAKAGPVRGSDLEIQLVVPLEKIYRGGDESFRFSRAVMCTACKGSGLEAGTQARKCEACNGSGQKVVSHQEQKETGSIRFQQIMVCPVCHGQGAFVDHPCKQCNGTGQQDKDEKLSVTIPAGIDEGMVLRIAGHGAPSPEAGGPPGDLFVVIHSQPDHRFERRGADLWRSETIEVADAVLGTTLYVEGLDGKIKVKVPAGSQPDEILRLRGKGLNVYGSDGRGDLNILLQVHIPEHPSSEEKALYKQLKQMAEENAQKKHFWE